MKNLKLAFGVSFVLAMLAWNQPSHASLSVDGDRMDAILSCYTPHVADAGFRVLLSEGGVVYHKMAKIQEVTFRGSFDVGTYMISMKQRNGYNVYVDEATQGRDFSLALYGNVSANSDSVRAQLNADTRAGRISQELICQPMYHILNSDIE